MNNNRNNNSNNNNNRRRGRGNRNQSGGGGGGGNLGNRIDSRARGNAPQMLDKFKKLAQDAQHNDDRVQAEYYLQFADHYFRVIADNRIRQEEPRGARRDERDQDDFDSEDDNDGDGGRRYDSPRENARETSRDGQRDTPRENPRERPRREERPRVHQEERASEGAPIESDGNGAFEPADNPFMREVRDDTAPRPKRAPRARRANSQEPGIDAAVLPPSISANDTGDRATGRATGRKPAPDTGQGNGQEPATEGSDGPADEAAPRPRRKRSDGGTLSAVG